MTTKKQLKQFRLLTEYECGRAQMAIEWTARAQKPIVEIGGRPIKECDIAALAYDLNYCISKSGERVRAFIMPDKIPNYCCYGFYRYQWAMDALLLLWSQDRSRLTRPETLRWMQGLVFGYSPDAIQRFRCASRERVSKSRLIRGTLRRVEIYGPLVSLVRGHNKLNGKFQKRG